METTEHVDVLIIGAGLSGIGAACQLSEHLPDKTITILEARERSGGTWDLFRYPGVRSDSDMFTFGYRWRPWPSNTALADGELILRYLRTVASEYGVDELIRYRHQVVSADFDSATARWTVDVLIDGAPSTITAGVVWSCSGYYDYDEGYSPDFPGQDTFAGQVVHPQFWPEGLDYAGKDIVVIGSGATAITLVPSMAGPGDDKAGHVTMLQRSPTYILSQPAEDPLGVALRRLPESVRYPIVRWANVLKLVGSYQFSRRQPRLMKRIIRTQTEKQLPFAEHGIDVAKHFQPTYNPWDQRLCVVPRGDLFKALRAGTASVVTDTIDTFTPTGIRLSSGEELAADIVVTATGLKLKPFGGLELSVDGVAVKLSELMTYKALMLSGLPNFFYTMGYTNASWTLKADLVSEYVIRVLRHMDAAGASSVTPVRDPGVGEGPFLDLAAGYVLRAVDELPRQGDRAPWRLTQNYLSDLRMIRRGEVVDDVLEFA